jgi:hypothetical protein
MNNLNLIINSKFQFLIIIMLKLSFFVTPMNIDNKNFIFYIFIFSYSDMINRIKTTFNVFAFVIEEMINID